MQRSPRSRGRTGRLGRLDRLCGRLRHDHRTNRRQQQKSDEQACGKEPSGFLPKSNHLDPPIG